MFKKDHVHRILIIQLQPFGDVLLNTSYLEAIRQHFPTAKLDFLVSKPYDSVLTNNPYINELVTFPKKKGFMYGIERVKLFFRIFARRYDLVVDQQCGTGSAQITFFSRAKYRLGYANRKWSWIYNLKGKPGKQRYTASQKFDILATIGIQEQPYELYYYIKPESIQKIDTWLQECNLDNKKLICLSPGSPVQRKKWNPASYAALADKIITDTDFEVILLWGPGEKEDVDLIANLMATQAIMALPTTYSDAAALLHHCALLLCNDGGLNHLAVTTHTPSLAFFGPTNPINWCPGSVFPIHQHLGSKDTYKKGDNSFGITPEMAYDKLREMLF